MVFSEIGTRKGTATAVETPLDTSSEMPMSSPGEPPASSRATTQPADGMESDSTITDEPSERWSMATMSAGLVATGSSPGSGALVVVVPDDS